jgi:hypothetical protein
MEATQSTETKVTYPTLPDSEGFFFESDTDQSMQIYTKVYENGNKVKKVVLPFLGKTAVVRELLAKDTHVITRHMGGDQEKYNMACITVATTFDGDPLPIEVISVLKMKDYSRLLSMYQDINF